MNWGGGHKYEANTDHNLRILDIGTVPTLELYQSDLP